MRSLRSSIGALLACTTVLALPSAAIASQVKIYAAGSLTTAMNDLIRSSGLPQGDFAPPVYGPAGLLRERLQKGETADIFASADTQQAARLAADHFRPLSCWFISVVTTPWTTWSVCEGPIACELKPAPRLTV